MAIVGVGLCCSIGHSFEAASAAYREGVRAFVKTDDLIGPDGLSLRIAPVFAAHEIRNFEVRLQRLFGTAAADLSDQLGSWVKPTPLRLLIPAWLTDNPIATRLSEWIAATWPSLVASVELVSAKDAMALAELARGILAIREKKQEAVIVAALDSFLHAELLDRLALDNRLLTREQPHGVIPSEAAVLFYLAEASAARPPRLLGRVLAAWPGRESEDVRRPQGLIGRPLARAVSIALARSMPDRLMVDLNGERWRAEELAVVLSAAPPLPDRLEADFETPPLTAGHCGAATGMLMAALALNDQPPGQTVEDGGREASETTLISTSQFDGLRAVALIERYRQPVLSMESAS
ncbi:hypothetical protein L0F51_19625 [Afifella sp. H1R]|uniref:hypothetical protein n=1 Tax=Afifella sp. H1R TaxID=2908841 RepID=UPI001F32BF0A|nr:hypothetical protein [Afifella sp. H1R]MCF1505974.1 hypothetical protein [Afifella sp. H1R]